MANWTEADLRAFEQRRLSAIPLTVSKRSPQVVQSSAGKRADLGGRFFRSKMEANVARYLNWLQGVGAVLKWEYESEEYEFHKIRRGNRFYKIDFKIWFAKTPEQPIYWEVKGYMDAKSRTKLKRMARYYPHIPIVIVGKESYREMKSHQIPGWE